MAYRYAVSCSSYDAWLEEWRGRNGERFDMRAQLWGRAQGAAMARYLGVIERYEQLCIEGGHLLTQLYDVQGDMVRFRLAARW